MATSPTTAQRRVTLPTAAVSQRGESTFYHQKCSSFCYTVDREIFTVKNFR